MSTKTETRGRKPLPPNKVRGAIFQFRCTNEERAELLAASDMPTVWVRNLALKAARRKARTQ